MNRLLYILLALCCTLNVHSAVSVWQPADEAYHSTDYQKALTLYKSQLPKNTSAELYYNLGNTYYRMGSIAKALLYYEKAAKISPMDNDIQHNIEIARAKTPDRLPAETEILFKQWYRNTLSLMSPNGWAYTALTSLIVALILFLAYLFLNNISIRRISFYTSVTLLVVFVIGNLFAWQRQQYLATQDTAIIMIPVTAVKTSPTSKATDACIIHEGTKVRITDHDMKDWIGIRLPDGKEGWIPLNTVEKI